MGNKSVGMIPWLHVMSFVIKIYSPTAIGDQQVEIRRQLASTLAVLRRKRRLVIV
jgi:hypothetical protein